jgi:hypothetical protein
VSSVFPLEKLTANAKFNRLSDTVKSNRLRLSDGQDIPIDSLLRKISDDEKTLCCALLLGLSCSALAATLSEKQLADTVEQTVTP